VVNGPTLCSAVRGARCHGDTERSMVPLICSFRCPWPIFLVAVHLTSIHKSHFTMIAPSPHIPSLPWSVQNASQRPHRHVKLSPRCARRGPRLAIPCPGLGPIIRHGATGQPKSGGGVIMEPSSQQLAARWMDKPEQDATRHSLTSLPVHPPPAVGILHVNLGRPVSCSFFNSTLDILGLSQIQSPLGIVGEYIESCKFKIYCTADRSQKVWTGHPAPALLAVPKYHAAGVTNTSFSPLGPVRSSGSSARLTCEQSDL
jgi:hypothetical protein